MFQPFGAGIKCLVSSPVEWNLYENSVTATIIGC